MNNQLLERLLNSLKPEILDLVIKLRILVIGSNPSLVERVYPSWKTIGYGTSVKMSAQVCFIEAHEKYVRLGFNRGAKIADPMHLLQSQGDLLCYFQFEHVSQINNSAILEMLKSAWEEARQG